MLQSGDFEWRNVGCFIRQVWILQYLFFRQDCTVWPGWKQFSQSPCLQTNVSLCSTDCFLNWPQQVNQWSSLHKWHLGVASCYITPVFIVLTDRFTSQIRKIVTASGSVVIGSLSLVSTFSCQELDTSQKVSTLISCLDSLLLLKTSCSLDLVTSTPVTLNTTPVI